MHRNGLPRFTLSSISCSIRYGAYPVLIRSRRRPGSRGHRRSCQPSSITKRSVDAAGPAADRRQPRRTIYFDRALPGFGLLVTPSRQQVVRGAVPRRPWPCRADAPRHHRPLRRPGPGAGPRRGQAHPGRGRAGQGPRSRARGQPPRAAAPIAIWRPWSRNGYGATRPATAAATKSTRIMEREVLPALGSAPDRRDPQARPDRARRGRRRPRRTGMANRVLAHTKRLFRWAAGRDLIETDPAAHIEKPSPETQARPGADRRRAGRRSGAPRRAIGGAVRRRRAAADCDRAPGVRRSSRLRVGRDRRAGAMHPPAAGAEQGQRGAGYPAVAAGAWLSSTRCPRWARSCSARAATSPSRNISHSKRARCCDRQACRARLAALARRGQTR